jgi:pyrimidine operon attenuation protein / uracil phosphoribosyltransferase
MKKKILSQNQVRDATERIARAILKGVKEPRPDWALVGIQRRGVPLARRLAFLLQDAGVPHLPVGTLDITFYRDDTESAPLHPVVHDTDVPFDVAGKTDELMDFGRPRRVYLAVLVDRGHRELPIQADFTGEVAAVPRAETVEVHLEEVDGDDAVWVIDEKERAAARGRE